MLLNRCYDQQNIIQAIQRIRICEVYGKYRLLKRLKQLWEILPKEEKMLRTRVIIIDSLSVVLRECVEEQKENRYLSRLASICRFLAKEYSLSIIIVNLIIDPNEVAESDAFAQGYARSQFRLAALGKYWLQVPNVRLLLEETRKEQYQITLCRSLYQEIGLKCTMYISDAGVT
ncbi:hypothetical protein KM043_004728 [Ampulex compressa]|nr:hypothetical protein KM043_004728 [Ampulex compressa]